MPATPNNKHVLRSPFEKAIKNSSAINEYRYSKNIKTFEEKRLKADLFPIHQARGKREKITFTFPPNSKFLSFRKDVNLELHGRIIVQCIADEVSTQSPSKSTPPTKQAFHLSEHKMNVYLNNGINKFIKNIRCTLNDTLSVNTSTLSFNDYNSFSLYHDIETSFLKSTDPFLESNKLMDNISQLTLPTINNEQYGGYTGETIETMNDIKTPRIWRTTLPGIYILFFITITL